MNDLLPHLKILDGRSDQMLNQVIELCDINSGTTNLEGLAQVKEKLANYFACLGGDLHFVDSDHDQILSDQGKELNSPLGQSIHIIKRPNADKKALLCIHMDTVYRANDPFQKCVLRDDGTVNGPGVADAKGGIIVMLHAVQALEASPFANNIGWEILLNADEEIGSPGSRHLIDSIAPRCDFGLLFEPALGDNKLVSWRKGSGNFSLLVKGKSAHAGRAFAEGRNAVVMAAELASDVHALNSDPEITFNVAGINGGSPMNVVPEIGIVRVNVRVKTPAEQSMVERQLQSLVEKFNDRDGFTASMHGGFRSPPKPITEPMQQLMNRIERCGNTLDMDIEWQGTGGASDGNKFAAAGLPNVDSLGPCGGRIHSDQEFMIVESLVPRAKLAAMILMDSARATAE
jgi:glutamate carboxypeptidase